jgi:C-terminal processing protease CtpA/Prc
MVDSKYDVWRPGQVKLELKKINDSIYTAILYMRDHSYRAQKYYFNGTNLDGSNWKKVNKPQPAIANKAYGQFHFEKVKAKKLGDSTLYIQIGTFALSNTRAIDSVFRANESVLKTTPYLILDLRMNGGGGDESFNPILPYVYTNPIIAYGNDVYATADNVKRTEARLNDPDRSESNKEQIKEVSGRMKLNLGKFVTHMEDDTVRFDNMLPYPKEVVVLIDNGCASSTEEFLLAAKQSSKVTIMGQHSYGELDYSNWLIAASPCSDIEFHYSSTKSRRINAGKEIDGVGVKPDIQLSYDEDWIEVARKYLEK